MKSLVEAGPGRRRRLRILDVDDVDGIHALAGGTRGGLLALPARLGEVPPGVELVLDVLGAARDLLHEAPPPPIAPAGHRRRRLFSPRRYRVGGPYPPP